MSLSPLSFQQPSIHLFGWDREEDVELPLMFQTHTSAFSSSSPPPLQADQYFTFVDFEDSDTTPTSDSKQNKKDQKIGRPPNSFLLFRRDFQAREAKKLPANSKRPTCASWSSKASAAWREMDTATRKRWEDMAATEKALHAQLHPDYKFRPNKRRKNEKNAHAPTAQCPAPEARPSSSPLSRSTSSSSSDSPSTPGPLSRTTSTSSSSWDFDPPDTSIWPTLFDFGSTEYNDVQQPQVFIPNDLQEDLDRMNSLNYDYYVGNLMGRGYNYQ